MKKSDTHVPIMRLLAAGPSSAATLARELKCTEAEALGHLGWHEERGNVRRESKTWKITADGREWYEYKMGTPAPKPARSPRESAQPAKRKPESADIVRQRLTEAGLWDRFVEFARAHGVPATDLAGPLRTQYLTSVRHAWFNVLLNEPGRKRSSGEVARLCGRRDHSTVLHGVALLRARENKAA